jgi:PAS domain S-box-containing protein
VRHATIPALSGGFSALKPFNSPSVEKKPARHGEKTNRTDHESICPVTSLPVVTKPGWTDIPITENYSVSFSLVGNAILHTVPKGIISDESMRGQIAARERVLREANLLGNRYVEIRNYGRTIGRPSKVSRMLLTNLLVNEAKEGNLLGFLVFNAPPFVRWLINVGRNVFRPVSTVSALRDYSAAVRKAVQVLARNGIDVGMKHYMRFTKDNWSLELENYGVHFELIGDDTLYTVAHGSLKEAYIEQFFTLITRVLDESGLTERGYYYRIFNWEKLDKSTWKASRMYISGINTLQKKVPCRLSVLFGLNKTMRAIIGLSGRFVPNPIDVTGDFEEALARVGSARIKQVKEKNLKTKTYTEKQVQQYSDKLIDFMGVINWDQAGTSWEDVSHAHPFKAVFDAIAIIKGDIDDLFHERNQAFVTLRESELKFRTLIESSSDSIFIMKDNVFVDCNDRALGMFLCCKEDITNHSPEDVSPGFQPDGRLSSEKAVEKLNLALKGTPQYFEWKHQRMDGTVFDAEVSLNSVELGGETYIQAIVRDITKRKRDEEELKSSLSLLDATLESTADGILVVNRAGRIVRWNRKFVYFTWPYMRLLS